MTSQNVHFVENNNSKYAYIVYATVIENINTYVKIIHPLICKFPDIIKDYMVSLLEPFAKRKHRGRHRNHQRI